MTNTTTTQEAQCIAAVTELLGKHFHASMRYGQTKSGGYDPQSSTAYAEVQAVKDQIISTVWSYLTDISPSSFDRTPPAEQPAEGMTEREAGLVEALEAEERDHLNTIQDRDNYHEYADKLTEVIADYFGVDFGEHSNMNNPWLEAIEFVESHLASKREQPADEQPCPHCHGITPAELVVEQNEAFEAGRKYEREQPAERPPTGRCAGCDIANGCPEYCRCQPATAQELPKLPELTPNYYTGGVPMVTVSRAKNYAKSYGQQCATQATAALRAELFDSNRMFRLAHIELTTLREQAERDARDADRYRWLRDKANFGRKSDPMVCLYPLDDQKLIDGVELDEAVDAAIAKQKDQP